VALLITVGFVGLQALSDVNRRAEELVELQRKIAAYRQLQHGTTAQLYYVASALDEPNEETLAATLRQLNQFGFHLDWLEFVAKDEGELISQVRKDYGRFIQVETQVVELIRAGKVAEGREIQLAQASPLADRLERLLSQRVSEAEDDMAASIELSHAAYLTSRWVVIGFAVGSIGLALILGYAISWSLIGPVRTMDARLKQIATGDFSQRVEVPNQDELGTLAANLNHMSEELGRLYQQIEEWNRTLEDKVRQQVDQIQRMSRLKRYLSPQVAETILQSEDYNLFKGHRRDITVVSLDLRGFTAFSDSAEPEEVLALLRSYHAEMGDLIFKFEGTLERFAGDGIMVFFNDPIPCEEHTEKAVRMAVEMRARVKQLRQEWLNKGYDLDLGVGLAADFATLGTIGFEGRMDYGAVGNVTNLAARLCGEAKGGQVLTNQKTLSKIEHLIEAEFLEELHLKGFARPVPAFNIVNLKA
jgi:adenylate cyclase